MPGSTEWIASDTAFCASLWLSVWPATLAGMLNEVPPANSMPRWKPRIAMLAFSTFELRHGLTHRIAIGHLG